MKYHFEYSFPIILLIPFFFTFFNFSSCLIIIPFEITNQMQEKQSKNIDLMSYLNNLSLYSNISIGTPPQQIKALITFNQSGFNIPNNSYVHKNSKTYNELSENRIIYDETEYNGTFSSDNIILINIDSNSFSQIIQKSDYNKYLYNEKNRIIFKNISFINKLSDEIGVKNYGYLGFKFPNKDKLDIINFVPLLKNKNITNNYAWTLLFESKNDNNICTFDSFAKIKGKVILGDELYNYYPNKYKSNNSYNISIIARNQILNWDLQFSNIYFSHRKFYISTIAEIRPDLPLNFGSLSFKLNMDEFFFIPLLNQKICQVKNMTLFPDIFYYMCDKTKKGKDNLSFELEKFPNITFEYKIFGLNFSLNYKDLFVQDNKNKNIFYFIFVFDRRKIYSKNEDRFVLGMKFFEKYQFEFDNDKKIIRYYENLSVKEKFKKNKNNYKIILLIVLIILFGIILFALGMVFQKKILKIPRKARANELDEDFDYKSKNYEKNEDINLHINE